MRSGLLPTLSSVRSGGGSGGGGSVIVTSNEQLNSQAGVEMSCHVMLTRRSAAASLAQLGTHQQKQSLLAPIYLLFFAQSNATPKTPR